MINNLLECTKTISDEIFFIIDDKEDEPPYIVGKDGEFKIINSQKKELSFISIDSCIYGEKDIARCDCAIYDDKTFCFIELKHTKTTNWKRRRSDAEKQVEATINNFKNDDIVKGKILEAYMCCNCTIDNEYTKIQSASNSSEKITYFELELNTSLYCDTKKEFN